MAGGNRPLENGIMAGEGGFHRFGILLPKTGATFDVCEQKCNDTGWCSLTHDKVPRTRNQDNYYEVCIVTEGGLFLLGRLEPYHLMIEAGNNVELMQPREILRPAERMA